MNIEHRGNALMFDAHIITHICEHKLFKNHSLFNMWRFTTFEQTDLPNAELNIWQIYIIPESCIRFCYLGGGSAMLCTFGGFLFICKVVYTFGGFAIRVILV